MKSQLEIQRAHDLLVGMILGEAPCPKDKDTHQMMKALAGVLCWVLEHDHNPQFGCLLKQLEEALLKAGNPARPPWHGKLKLKQLEEALLKAGYKFEQQAFGEGTYSE